MIRSQVPLAASVPAYRLLKHFASDLKGPLLVNGHLHVQNNQVRLCEVLAESLPPQCGGGILVVKGLDLTTLDGLSSAGSVTWSDQPVQVLGTVKGEVLTVSETAR